MRIRPCAAAPLSRFYGVCRIGQRNFGHEPEPRAFESAGRLASLGRCERGIVFEGIEMPVSISIPGFIFYVLRRKTISIV